MTMASTTECNFATEVSRAKKMSYEALIYSINDAQECVRQGINVGKYTDQISVYRQELARRKVFICAVS